MEDHHVDRPGVEAQQCVKLTGTNRSFGLIRSFRRMQGPEPLTATTRPRQTQLTALVRPLPFRRPGGHGEGPYTRSHPELGRENPQRQWYCVLRRGRVGRRQVFRTEAKPERIPNHNPKRTSDTAGWSSPVARQAHNLKVVGSNPTPATKASPIKSSPAVERPPGFFVRFSW